MSAALALQTARDAGVRVALDGDGLELSADAPPPDAVVELLTKHKPEIIAWLQPGADGWSAADWHERFEERAAVAEFDGGGFPREAAEARAYKCVVADWLELHPVTSPPDRCLACGREESGSEPLLPFGTESTGHAWLHGKCWPGWYASRKAEAVAALAAIGIIDRKGEIT
jgi:hypothetical protein